MASDTLSILIVTGYTHTILITVFPDFTHIVCATGISSQHRREDIFLSDVKPLTVMAKEILTIVNYIGRIIRFATFIFVDNWRNCIFVRKYFPLVIPENVVGTVVLHHMPISASVMIQYWWNLLFGRNPFPSPIPTIAENTPVISDTVVPNLVLVVFATDYVVVVKIADRVPVVIFIAAVVTRWWKHNRIANATGVVGHVAERRDAFPLAVVTTEILIIESGFFFFAFLSTISVFIVEVRFKFGLFLIVARNGVSPPN